jgi:hypothetical protein
MLWDENTAGSPVEFVCNFVELSDAYKGLSEKL